MCVAYIITILYIFCFFSIFVLAFDVFILKDHDPCYTWLAVMYLYLISSEMFRISTVKLVKDVVLLLEPIRLMLEPIRHDDDKTVQLRTGV